MRTLVLSSGYMPLGTIPWERAFSLVYLGKADAIDFYEKTARSAKSTHKIPAVIRVKTLSKVQTRPVRFNKQNVFLRDGGICAYCMNTISFRKSTYDHVIPKSRGGQTKWDNIVLCCQECNGRKADRTPEEANMTLNLRPFKPAPISALKAFIQKYKSKAPKQWLQWIPN